LKIYFLLGSSSRTDGMSTFSKLKNEAKMPKLLLVTLPIRITSKF
jgi:hypothetical protein